MKRFSKYAYLLLVFCLATVISAFFSVYAEEYAPITVQFTDYQCGTVNKHPTSTVENVEYEGRNVVKIVPNPEYEDFDRLIIDAYVFSGCKIDIGIYKWLVIEYKYVSENPGDYEFIAHHKTNGGLLKKEYSQAARTPATKPVSEGEWQYAVFDFNFIDKMLVEDLDEHILSQMHIFPFGDEKLQTLSAKDTFYIGHFTFFAEEPNIELNLPIIEGCGDGTFRPGNYLTRAEACAMTARAISFEKEYDGSHSFTDVKDDEWYSGYVGYCAERGLLDEFGDTLSPDSYITRAEYSRLLYNCSLYMDGGKISEDALSFSGNDNPISRGDAVMMLNEIRGISNFADAISMDIVMPYFDVTRLHRSFTDVVIACSEFVSSDGRWLYSISDNITDLDSVENPSAYFDTARGEAFVLELDMLEEQRISEIRGTQNRLPDVPGYIYYVSNDGSDNNCGYNVYEPFGTLSKAISVAKSGDAIVLRRGDIFRGQVRIPAGVTLSAYGEGEKPKVYGSPLDGADPKLWELDYEDGATGAKIWRFTKEDMRDVGNIVFDGGRMYAYKDIPSANSDGGFMMRGDETKPYVYTDELDFDLNFFHDASSSLKNGKIDLNLATGALYLRCDAGNPGDVFESIEFSPRGNALAIGGAGVTVDNICVMYTGSHGIGSGTTSNLTVTNCEFGWIGGSVQHYNNTQNRATRFGNGVEIYGGCDGYLIENCYVYQCYDAGITHQLDSNGNSSVGSTRMDNVTYRNNLITDCVYSIEYFFNEAIGLIREGENILFENNILRRCGYGFGSTRPNGYAQRHIRSNPYGNPFRNYVIRNNIIDRSVQDLFRIQFSSYDFAPIMEDNIYIVGVGNDFFTYGLGNGITYRADVSANAALRSITGDMTGELYFVERIPYYSYDFNSYM